MPKLSGDSDIDRAIWNLSLIYKDIARSQVSKPEQKSDNSKKTTEEKNGKEEKEIPLTREIR